MWFQITNYSNYDMWSFCFHINIMEQFHKTLFDKLLLKKFQLTKYELIQLKITIIIYFHWLSLIIRNSMNICDRWQHCYLFLFFPEMNQHISLHLCRVWDNIFFSSVWIISNTFFYWRVLCTIFWFFSNSLRIIT